MRVMLDVALVAGLGWAGVALFSASRANSNRNPDARPSSLSQLEDSVVGRALPAFTSFAPKGQRSVVSFELRTEPTLVFVFRSDCRFCEATSPQWERLTTTLTSARVVAVNPEDPRTASRWLTRHTIRPGQLWIPTDLQEYFVKWAIPAVPATLVVDGGKVTYAHFGVLSDADVDSVALLMRASRVSSPINK